MNVPRPANQQLIDSKESKYIKDNNQHVCAMNYYSLNANIN